MTLFKVILLSFGCILALYFLWQLVALPLIGYVIDRLTFRRKAKIVDDSLFIAISKTNQSIKTLDNHVSYEALHERINELKNENMRLKAANEGLHIMIEDFHIGRMNENY